MEKWLPTRYLALAIVAAALVLALLRWPDGAQWRVFAAIFGVLTAIGFVDLVQRRSTLRRNYPLLAHIRFFFESVRPMLRQYVVESDNEEVPFSHVQRAIVKQRAKNALDVRPFGTELDVYAERYEWINHSIVPSRIDSHDFRIVVGGPECTQPYSASVFNISAMSFGAISPNAIRALNEGARRGGFYHDTGEGSLSPYHRENGGDIVWEIGSGYFGACERAGVFSEARFADKATLAQVKMIELKLSQGAKPGHGGVLPAAEGHRRNRGDARRCDGRGLHFAGAAFDVRHARRFAAFHRALARVVRRQADRLQARARPSVGMVRHRQGDDDDRHPAGFHRRRRQGRRHRRGAARIHRSCRRAAARRADDRAQHAGRAQLARSHLHRRRAARSSPRSTSRACSRSAPTGATRRAVSCSRSAVSSRKRAIPIVVRPASRRRIRAAGSISMCRTRPRACATFTRTR